LSGSPAPAATSGPVETRLLSVDEARDRVLGAIAGPLAAESVDVVAALGRAVAEPVVAATSLPPWDNSAMDGYAIRAADTTGASEANPVQIRVIGEVAAGAPPRVRVETGSCARIATGARLPDGADAVIPVELTTPIDAAGNAAGPRGREAAGPLPAAILAHAAVPEGGSIRRAGSDLRSGAELLVPGTTVSPASVALVAGAGTATIRVHRRPRVAVLATGDEVRGAGEALGDAGIPDANRPALLAQVAAAGGTPIDLGIATDSLDDVVGRLRTALTDRADVVIVSGGVSVGPYDVVKPAFETVGQIDLWRVAVQPGKPFAFGTASRADGPPALLFGLPGNPVSSVVTFELFVRPALRRLAGHHGLLRPVDRGVLGEAVSKSAGRRAFLRVVAERDDRNRPRRDATGRIMIRLAGGQGSHVLSALAAADALAVIPEASDELPAGAEVELWWLDPS
jgi:molybdopterin molybdotransferase